MKIIKYRNSFEKSVAAWLTKHKIWFAYEEYRIVFLSSVRGGQCENCKSMRVVKSSSYLTDFTMDAFSFIIEAKGHMPSAQRTRYIALQKAGHDIRFVFQRDNKLSSKSGTRYSDWADRYGFKYSMNLPDPKWFRRKK